MKIVHLPFKAHTSDMRSDLVSQRPAPYHQNIMRHLDNTKMKSETVKTWIDGIKPEHGVMAQKVDDLIKEIIPDIQFTTKWHKPSQPLGVPFYGLTDKGWMIAMWSFKNEFSVGFIAGTLLDPEPLVTKMSGPWNRNSEYKARRIDIRIESEFDEKLIRSWIKQSKNLPGWSKIKKKYVAVKADYTIN